MEIFAFMCGDKRILTLLDVFHGQMVQVRILFSRGGSLSVESILTVIQAFRVFSFEQLDDAVLRANRQQ